MITANEIVHYMILNHPSLLAEIIETAIRWVTRVCLALAECAKAALSLALALNGEHHP